jgi:hypothetical protein
MVRGTAIICSDIAEMLTEEHRRTVVRLTMEKIHATSVLRGGIGNTDHL